MKSLSTSVQLPYRRWYDNHNAVEQPAVARSVVVAKDTPRNDREAVMEILLSVENAPTPTGGVAVVARGEVDFSTAGLLDDRVVEADELVVPPRSVVVDLSGVTFLSAAGVGVLVAAHHRSLRRGVPLWVVVSHRSVLRTLTACDALSVLRVVDRSPAPGTGHPNSRARHA